MRVIDALFRSAKSGSWEKPMSRVEAPVRAFDAA